MKYPPGHIEGLAVSPVRYERYFKLFNITFRSYSKRKVYINPGICVDNTNTRIFEIKKRIAVNIDKTPIISCRNDSVVYSGLKHEQWYHVFLYYDENDKIKVLITTSLEIPFKYYRRIGNYLYKNNRIWPFFIIKNRYTWDKP